MSGVVNIRQTGRLGRQAASEDATTGLILMVPAPSEGQSYTVGHTYEIGEISDLEALGINEAFDDANELQAWNSVKEFREFNPSAKLYVTLLPVAQNAVQAITYNNGVSKLMQKSQGAVKQIGLVVETTDVPVGYDDFDEYVAAIIAQAQLSVNTCLTHGHPVVIIVEGFRDFKDFDGSEANAFGVGLFFGQSNTFFSKESISNYQKKRAAIGICMAVIAANRVNDNIGWVEKNNVKIGSLINARLDETLIDELTNSIIESREDKRHIFFRTYTDYPGIYINNDFTCTVSTDDFSSISRNRTWNKASRLIRQATLPKVNSTVFINTENGQIDSLTITEIENAGNRAIRPMFTDGEISGPDPNGANPPFTIDPAQDVLATDELKTQLSIVPTGVASTITNYIGFNNPAI